MSSVANACTRAAHACTKVFARPSRFSMQLRTLAHSLIVGPQRAFVHKLSTRSALGAFPARCWTCSGCQQPAISCAGGKNC